jgi:iron complex outermembrane recepter protein
MKALNNAGARPRVGALSSAIAAALAGFSSAGYVQAQEAEPARQAEEEITVTGSRIIRRDFTANSPIQTVGQEMFEETSAIGVETVLNRLPQFVPAVTQFTTGDVQQTVTNTVGASTVSLRGLGPNRNLVLINGRRAMPVDPRMVVDTNSIPAGAIQRVEVISGGASAVYGADAVGGVVNFILKDNFEGATVDVRFGDTQHGGDQTTTISGLIGANTGDGRGNVMIGIERDTRTKQYQWQRDWRVADYANPNTAGGFFAFGSATWVHNEPGNTFVPNPNFNPNLPAGPTNPATVGNVPQQAVVDGIFNQLPPGTLPAASMAGGGSRFRLNRDGTIFSGLNDAPMWAPGAYRFTGPVYNGQENCPPGISCLSTPGSGDLDGDFQGLPVFVRQPDGRVKENALYSWASTPLERHSAFASGHFEVADNIRVTGQAMVTRTKTESSLGLTAANINQWGAGIPFGNELFRGSDNPYYEVPDSLVDNGDGTFSTHPAYTINGRFGVECDAPPTAEMPWLDGLPGCTKSEAWPTTPEVYNLMMSRVDPEAQVWLSREPDWMRSALGAGRSTNNITTTMSFTLGVEGQLPSGNHSWDVSLTTGRSDNIVNQLGSMRLTTYRDVLASPNYGRNATFDVNPWEFGGFAESIPTCTTGLPVVHSFVPSADCLQMVSPALKNIREMTQSILEVNLVGDLVEMPAGTLQYALGLAYRENSFDYVPDNLSDIQNKADPIAGLFPNESAAGEFDVSEIYGELLVPIVSDGPMGVRHFNLELGARVSDWSMSHMPTLNTYKALMDWAVSPRYRIRGGFNRAFRAPNLGELFSRRTQLFGGGGATRDWCSQNLSDPGTFSATPGANVSAQQNAQTLALCQALMGASGAAEYYVNRPVADQPTAGGLGIPISFGNPVLREEQADTWTIGVAMDVLEDWTLTVDWYQIEIENMIALEGADATYQRCLDLAFNPNGDLNNSACRQIARNPNTGAGGTVDRSFTNEGRTTFSGFDVALNWSRQLTGGGRIGLNLAANAPLEEVTQDRAGLPEIDHAGFNSCGLQMQCQNYDYRVFTNVSYGRNAWNMVLRHQHWPELKNNACRGDTTSVQCVYNSLPSHDLFALSGNYRFDRYMVSLGIENLLDKDPPCIGANPTAAGFPTQCTRTGNGATYDPLGRRFFLSMRMDF